MTAIATTIAALLERVESITKAAKGKGKGQPRWPSGNPKGGQFKAKGGVAGGAKAAAHDAQAAIAAAKAALLGTPPNAAYHPKAGDNGEQVIIALPTAPSDKATWKNPKAAAVFTPGGGAPKSLNGVAMQPWQAPTTKAGWNAVEGQMKDKEPPLPQVLDYQGNPKRPGAGVVVTEPDGRVWVVEPTNHFGGYEHSFPKGGAEPGIKRLQANAIKEAWEESGLKVEITGILGDYEGDTSIARYYTAKRTGGTPVDHGWETQAVKLVPAKELGKYLNRSRDKQIAADLMNLQDTGIAKFAAQRIAQVADIAETLAKAAKGRRGGNKSQARYPKGHPKGGQFKPKVGAAAGGSGGGGAKPTVTAAQAVAGAKAAAGQFEPAMLSGKNPDNSALKSANKKITAIAALANAGDVAGLHAIKPTEPGKGANPYQKGVWKAWQDATAHAAAVQQTGAGSVSTPQGRASKAPMKLTDMTYDAPKPGGSNAGAIYKDADGTRWLVKGTKGDPDMAKNEVLAARLYNASGANAPEMRLVEMGAEHGGGLGVASRMIDGKLTKPNSHEMAADLAREHFAHDAWLANWDAVGLAFDNIAITSAGKASRIDPGGALLYRAQGGKKGAAFDSQASEWHTLRDASKNPQSAAIFGKMTASELATSAAKLSMISDDTITKLVNDYGPGDAKGKADLATTLIARKQAVMAAGMKEHQDTFKEVMAELGSPMPAAAAAAKPSASTKPAAAKATTAAAASATVPAAAKATASADGTGIATPQYTGKVSQWNTTTINFNQKLQQGDVAGAAAYASHIAGKYSATNTNATKFKAYADAKLAQTKGVAAGAGAAGAAVSLKTTKPLNSAEYWKEKDAQLEQIKDQGGDKIKAFVSSMQDELGDMEVDIDTYSSFTDKAAKYAQSAPAVAAKPAAAAAAAAGAVSKPKYVTPSKANMTYWNSQTKKVEQAIAAGDLQTAANIVQASNKTWGADYHSPQTKANLKEFNTYAGALMAGGTPAGATGKATAARATATAAVEHAVATAAVNGVKDVAPAIPSKPTGLSSAANPNKTLMAKVDQVDNIAQQFATGALSKDDALKQLDGITFGSNTYGKKGATFKADVIAAITGGAAIAAAKPKAPAGQNPKIAAGGAKAKAATVEAQAVAAAAGKKTKGIDPKRLAAPPNFSNWEGSGKGLSSKPEINKANQDEANAMFAMASSGNLEALKAYKPISPSQHIAKYKQLLIEDVSIQLNPQAPAKDIKIGAGKTLAQAHAQLAKAATGLKHPAEVTQKLGYYPVIGKTASPEALAPPKVAQYFNGTLTDATYAAASTKGFSTLSSIQQQAVKNYTGHYYDDINASFRSGSPTKMAIDADEGIRKAMVMLKEGTVLSRKVRMSAAERESFAKSAVGKVIQEFGISSTSINPKVWSGNVHLRMTVGKGVKGLYVGASSSDSAGNPISKNHPEQEILLPSGVRMLVTKYTPAGAQPDGYGHGGSIPVFDVVVLPNE